MKRSPTNPFILGLTAHNLSVEIHHHAACQLVFTDMDTALIRTSTIPDQTVGCGSSPVGRTSRPPKD